MRQAKCAERMVRCVIRGDWVVLRSPAYLHLIVNYHVPGNCGCEPIDHLVQPPDIGGHSPHVLAVLWRQSSSVHGFELSSTLWVENYSGSEIGKILRKLQSALSLCSVAEVFKKYIHDMDGHMGAKCEIRSRRGLCTTPFVSLSVHLSYLPY